MSEAVRTLREADQTLFLLSQFEGTSAAELASVFETTPQAIRARLSRIRRVLRTRLRALWREW